MTKAGTCSHCGNTIEGGTRNGREGWQHTNPADKTTNGLHTAFPSS